MSERENVYQCLNCGRKITEEEYELYYGHCPECYELETAELDMALQND